MTRELTAHGKSATSRWEVKDLEATYTLSSMTLIKAIHLQKLAERTSLPSLSTAEGLDIIDYFNRDVDNGLWKSWYYGGQLGLARPAPLGKWRLKRMDCLLSKRLQELAGGTDTTDNTP